MYNIIVIRAHGCTIKELYEKINDKDAVIFQCEIGKKVPYWNNLDGALLFLKRAVSTISNFGKIELYPYYYKDEIPKTLLSGLDNDTIEICSNDFTKWLFSQKWYVHKTDIFIYPNEVAIKYHWLKQNDFNLLHCTIVGSSEKHSLGKLIEILKKEFSFTDSIYLAPICRTVVDDIVSNTDTPVIESSGHFSYKTYKKQDYQNYSEEDILSAIERNDRKELKHFFPYFLEKSTNIEKENLKQKVLNDYKGLNIPQTAEKVLDYIDISLFGENEYCENNFLDYSF